MTTSADIEMLMLRRMSEAGANTGKGIAYAGDAKTYFQLLDKYLKNKHFSLLEADLKKGNRRLALQRTQALIDAADRIGISRAISALTDLMDAIKSTQSALLLLRIYHKVKETCESLLYILDEPKRYRANQKENLFGIQDFCFVEQ